MLMEGRRGSQLPWVEVTGGYEPPYVDAQMPTQVLCKPRLRLSLLSHFSGSQGCFSVVVSHWKLGTSDDSRLGVTVREQMCLNTWRKCVRSVRSHHS